MNTKALRQKVLDLAIHGKLVPQNPNDESAEVLLKKIREEKAEKIKKGELKADKKDSFIFTKECEFDEDKLGKCSSGTRHKRHYEQFADGSVKDIEDEIPFEVPEGWTWCRLGNIGKWQSGTTPNKKNLDYYKNGTIPWLLTGDLNDGLVTEIPNCITEKALKETSLKINPIGSVCIAMYGATIGKLGILNTPATTNQACCVCYEFYGINNKYLFYFLKEHKEEFIQQGFGGAQPNISKEKIVDTFIPLPPLSEQECIVKSIETYFEQIDSLEENKYDLQTAIKQAKSKILDLAIHGKLVPQNPNDEPAEELLKRIATSDNRPYKKIDEDEALFDIPESWSWCTLGEIYTHTTGKALKKTNNKGTLRKYITTSNLYWNSFDFTEVREMYFTDDELEKCTIKKGDLILCNGGDVGRAAIWNYDYDICYQNHVSRLRPKNKNINNSFFLYVIMIYKQQGILNGKGVGIISLSASDLLSAVVPLPPYSEQNRIVEKIECLYGNLTIINNQL